MSATAEELMSVLMPIFETLRQQESLPCSYPLAMGSRPVGTCAAGHWVRERSARSVPMGRTASGRMSGTPDSLSDNESSPLYSRTPRKSSTPAHRSSLTPGGSLPGSRPASRSGSKPPSRHGSNLSLASSDDGTPSRIPRRSVTGTRSSGSTTPRKLTVPAVNGSTLRTRSPSGLNTSSTSTSSARSSIPRASSIPTIAGNITPGSRSRIPVYVGLAMMDAPVTSSSSSSGTRTPSGSSTPVPGSISGTKVTRKPSGASDTSTGIARKGSSKSTTPTDPRAPFRL